MTKILLVEDNDMIQDMLSERLARNGYQVIIATNGNQAVSLSRSKNPDLILMDMSLPVLDGWEATRQIRANPETVLIPIIALTAHAIEGDREKCLEVGCNDYISKPVDFPQLLVQMEKLLSEETSA